MDAAWLKQMSIQNAKIALAQAKQQKALAELEVMAMNLSKRINGGGISIFDSSSYDSAYPLKMDEVGRIEPVLTIHSSDKIIGKELADGWMVVDVKVTKDAYIFCFEKSHRIYNPYTFASDIKILEHVLTLGRELTNKERYLLVRSDNTFLELDRSDIKSMDRMLFWMNELLHK